MEPNTYCSSAAGTCPAFFVGHGAEPSVRAPSLLSPSFFAAPSPGLVAAASGSRSGPSWYQQNPPSPAQSLPSPFFPTAADAFPMMAYDCFDNPEAAFLGDQLEQGQSSSWSGSGLPQSPFHQGLLFGESAAPSEQIAAWQSDMSSFSSPSYAGGLQPQGSDNLVGFAQPTPSTELAPTLEDSIDALLREFPVDEEEKLPVVEEEEPLDVSDYLVSDPEELLPDASWTTAPTMAGTGSGTGPSASWTMAAGGSSGHNDLPAMLGPMEASTCTMISTSSGSSIEAMQPSAPVRLLVQPAYHGAGASSDFNSFVQPSSSSPVLASVAPSLQGYLLPVKQEVVMMDVADATTRRDTEIISLVDDDDMDDDELYVGDVPFWTPSPAQLPVADTSSSSSSKGSFGFGLNTLVSRRSSGQQSQEAIFEPAAKSRYNNVFGSWGSSSSSSLGFGSWGSSSSSSLGFGSWASSSSSSQHRFGSWGSSSSSSHSFVSGGSRSSTSFAGSTLCDDQSTSFDVYSSSSTLKISIRDKKPYTSDLPQLSPSVSHKARTSSRRSDSAGVVFTESEMKIIIKEKNLQEVLKTDPKRVRRILYNRAYAANVKARKDMRTKDLERQVETLEAKRRSLYAELQSLEVGSAKLRAHQRKMMMMIPEMEQQSELKDVVKELLSSQIKKLESININSLQ